MATFCTLTAPGKAQPKAYPFNDSVCARPGGTPFHGSSRKPADVFVDAGAMVCAPIVSDDTESTGHSRNIRLWLPVPSRISLTVCGRMVARRRYDRICRLVRVMSAVSSASELESLRPSHAFTSASVQRSYCAIGSPEKD